MELTLKSLKDTRKLAQKLLKDSPSVIALYGGLGSGKTTFVQFLAKALGIREKILSPTFVIMKVFALPHRIDNFKFLTHLDAYRLKSAKDLLKLDLKNILKDKKNIVIIEWPEKIKKYLPQDTLKIYFKIIGKNRRQVIVK